jgi:hypothetical protein
MSNIRDPKDYEATWWDWTPFNECFYPTKIRITDIDGFVERGQKFLVLETKKPKVSIPQGQMIMFEKMVKTGLFTVLVIWGETNTPQQALLITRNDKIEYKECNIDRLKSIIRQWFDFASSDHPSELHGVIDKAISLLLDTQGRITNSVLKKGEVDITFFSGILGVIVQKLIFIKERINL